MLLLCLLAQLIPARLKVISIDHQLQDQSAAWCQLVAQYCQSSNIPCHIAQVTVAQGNLEAQARAARYQVFLQQLKAHDVLVLAHHQQDQAETLLLRLLQGAGVQGLAAMRRLEVRQLQSNQAATTLVPPNASQAQHDALATDSDATSTFLLWRPFLELSKQQISAWCSQLQLDYVDDPMNHQLDYDRVWCRQQLWPVLKQRFPQMQNSISRCAQLMQDGQDILSEVLEQDWQHCVDASGRMDLTAYHQLSTARQRQLLSRWMQATQSYRPSLSLVEHLKQQVIAARADAQALLQFDGFCFVRYADYLYRYPVQLWAKMTEPVTPQTVRLSWQQTVAIPLGQMRIAKAKIGLDPSLLSQDLLLKPRLGGERILFWQRAGHRVLKKMLQDAKIAPWLRHQTQILMYHNVVLGVVCAQGFWLADSPYVKTQGWLPQINMDLSGRIEYDTEC